MIFSSLLAVDSVSSWMGVRFVVRSSSSSSSSFFSCLTTILRFDRLREETPLLPVARPSICDPSSAICSVYFYDTTDVSWIGSITHHSSVDTNAIENALQWCACFRYATGEVPVQCDSSSAACLQCEEEKADCETLVSNDGEREHASSVDVLR